jgi:lipoprotein-anchoring transpeptidase ErfK/SrfK
MAGQLLFFPVQAVAAQGDEMATAKQMGWMAAAAMAAILGARAAQAADVQTAKPQTTAAQTISASENSPKREVVVSLEDRKLALVEDGQVVKVYPVAVGKPSTPSPVGSFTIARRVANPTYHHNGKTVPPGPGNPVGTRWMGLSVKGYGIHGTNEPRSIGKAASHGCIRMAKADLEDLYPRVEVGDTVELVGHRDEETARLFGSGPAPAAQPALATNALPHAPATPTTNAVSANPPAAQVQLEAATAAVLTGAL